MSREEYAARPLSMEDCRLMRYGRRAEGKSTALRPFYFPATQGEYKHAARGGDYVTRLGCLFRQHRWSLPLQSGNVGLFVDQERGNAR